MYTPPPPPHRTLPHSPLKTLFNIVEAPLKNFDVSYKLKKHFDVCVVWSCSDGSINSRECKSFEIDAVTIYDWMSSFNKQSGLPFTLIQQSMGKKGKSGHLSIFTYLKHLVMLLKYKFFRASFLHPIKDTDSMYGHAAQICLKVETLLNNAFNLWSESVQDKLSALRGMHQFPDRGVRGWAPSKLRHLPLSSSRKVRSSIAPKKTICMVHACIMPICVSLGFVLTRRLLTDIL